VGDDYTVTEIKAPKGYDLSLVEPKTVTAAAAECSGVGTPADVFFVNDPLSSIQVKFESLAGSGVTAAKISCWAGKVFAETLLSPSPLDSTTGDDDWDDTDETYTNLKEGTYTCIIEIDP
jgi:hypothetical protein